MVDIPGNSTTTRSITVGGTTSDTLEVVGDHDWFRIELTAGQSISVFLDGLTLEDSYLRIYDSSGNLLFENDDINPGIVRDSQLTFTAGYTGTYYIDVGAWEEGYAGTYQLSVSTYTPPPVASIDEIADQLVNGYWGGDDHHFNVTQGGSITVNLTGLTAAGQSLAVAALQTWTDIIGVNFIQVSSGGQIVFDDDDEGAYSDSNWSNGIITSSFVNVSTDWLANYGTGLNTYSYQTYIHEIGHALGLGHAGNYNGEASFPYDALFYNDGWPVSVMSYFSQTDSSYYAGQGFDENYLVTPMLADILAMSTLYGLSTTTRTGNTTYGFNTNAGNQIYNASLYPNVAYTIYDSGGTDTLDYSGFGSNQKINLNPETFSNIGAEVGNVTIAKGVVIENAIGGSGSDTIIGNAANNVLSGGAGEDTVSYETATAGVTANLSTVAQQNTVGAGSDTLSGFERLIGSGFNDTLTGSSATTHIYGGGGNDVITSSGAGEHRLFGEDGDDRFVPGPGDDWLIGGDGFDTVDYSGATGSINAATNGSNNNTGNFGFDTIGEVEKIIGSNFNDTLWAFQVGHQVWGGAGNDTLKGSSLGASQLYGGIGNDTFEVRHAANQVIEAAGEGIDLVMAEANFTLGANIEDLTLVQPVYDPYAGAGLGQGPPFDDFSGTGNNLANVIIGNRGDNVLAGLAGADTLTGGEGNDTLDGGADADTLAGGLGNDDYSVDNSGDVVTESSGEGTDIVRSSISWALGSNFENLTLTGSSTINGVGNSLANVITGNGAANVLDGGSGADQLVGGAGDDIFYVDQAGDAVAEASGEGTDEIRTALAYTLGANIENLRLTGTAAVQGAGNILDNIIRGNDAANLLLGAGGADKLYGYGGDDALDGGEGDDYLYGLDGNDTLTGANGYDRMYGGVGDDTFSVNDATDFAYELAGEGTDLVIATLDHQLRDHVENLTLVGSAVVGKGNAGDNGITGSGGISKLYGYDGNDVLDGGQGDDYVAGGNGNDTLIGGIGYDKMYGGAGDDTFIVNDATDFAYENVGEGHDTVIASVTHALRDNIEELELTGTDDIRGYGNASDNFIVGNSGANLLYGRDGNDTLEGNAGNDLLYGENGNDWLEGGAGQDRFYGGAGADKFIFNDGHFSGPTPDRIMDFSQAEGDLIDLFAVDANSALAGDQAFSFIGTSAFSHSAGELRSFQAGGVTYVQGDTNGDGTADFLIRVDGLHSLQASDFVI